MEYVVLHYRRLNLVEVRKDYGDYAWNGPALAALFFSPSLVDARDFARRWRAVHQQRAARLAAVN